MRRESLLCASIESLSNAKAKCHIFIARTIVVEWASASQIVGVWTQKMKHLTIITTSNINQLHAPTTTFVFDSYMYSSIFDWISIDSYALMMLLFFKINLLGFLWKVLWVVRIVGRKKSRIVHVMPFCHASPWQWYCLESSSRSHIRSPSA